MYVINLAPAKFLHRDSGVSDVMNYICDRDIVHLWDFMGGVRAVEEGSCSGLKSVKGTPFPDHGILSPTFEDPIQGSLNSAMKQFYFQ
jgi:Mn-containing catalase